MASGTYSVCENPSFLAYQSCECSLRSNFHVQVWPKTRFLFLVCSLFKNSQFSGCLLAVSLFIRDTTKNHFYKQSAVLDFKICKDVQFWGLLKRKEDKARSSECAPHLSLSPNTIKFSEEVNNHSTMAIKIRAK